MTLSLDEVREVRFHMARRSGYEVTDVDNFVDKVEATMAQQVEEIDMLKRQIESLGKADPDGADPALAHENERLKRELQEARAQQSADGGEREASLQAENEHLHGQLDSARADLDQARQDLSNAGGTVERIEVATKDEASPAVVRLLSLATTQAEDLVDGARQESEQLLDDARRKAHEITIDAKTKAERVESEARVNAEKMTAAAQNEADRLSSDVAARRQELFTELEHERDVLSSRVGDLRTFEQTFRSNMKDHLTRQISYLDGEAFEPGEAPGVLDEAQPLTETSSTPRLDALLGDDQA